MCCSVISMLKFHDTFALCAFGKLYGDVSKIHRWESECIKGIMAQTQETIDSKTTKTDRENLVNF